MADELIDILDRNGKSTGKVTLKSEAHRQGLYHASVHIWFYTSDGEVLLQKRAKDKDTFPNLWDVSVAGHIGAGETKEDSALREIKEEIGLSIRKKDLEFIGIYFAEKQPKPDVFDNEFHYIFLSVLHTTIEKLLLQEEEVEEVKLIMINDLEKEITNDEFHTKYVPHDIRYYDFILKEITKRLI